MQYRGIQKEDVSELARLYTEAFNSPPWNDEWTEETASNRLMQMIKCDGFFGLVCYEEDNIQGLILGNHEHFYDGMHFYIKEFCVDMKLRNKGIGSALFEEFIIRLKARGIDEIILFTSRTDGTEGFYHKRGLKSYNSMVMMGKVL